MVGTGEGSGLQRHARKGARRAALAVAMLFASSALAFATDLPTRKDPVPPAPVASPSGWVFQATAYGWLTALNGDVGARGRTVGVDVSFADILKHLKGVFMGAFQAKNETWAILTDVVWSDIGAKKSTRYGGVLEFGQTLGLAEGYVGYRLPFGSPSLDIRGLVGVRGQNLTETITHTGVLPVFDRSFKASQQWVDPLVGVSIQYAIDQHWFVNAIGDVGGFNVGSKLTAQGFLAVGYKWTDSISTSLGYRALYTDYEKSGTVYKTTMHGIFLGLGVHF